jgi:hypothetical protein
MPIHDWTKVDAGIFHHFHTCWIPRICAALNDNLLPPEYYALLEQVTRPVGPDVLTLQSNGVSHPGNGTTTRKSVAVLETPPKVQIIQESDEDLYVKKANRVAIRHVSDDGVIAIVEVLSPGNKNSRHGIDALMEKVCALIDQGIHLLLIDLFPPTRRDPQGIHALIWGDSAATAPLDQTLTLAAYHAVVPRRAYVEPTAIGNAIIDMPLFLDEEHYVPVPLEATYQAAWREVPQRWKAVLEAPRAT